MSKVSRRALAEYAADQLVKGQPAAKVAQYLASALIESGRMDELQFLLGDLDWQLEKLGILASGQVTTATPLTKELEAELKAQIRKAVKVQDVLLEENIDKSVVGGIRVETAGQVWDATVAGKLNSLREGA